MTGRGVREQQRARTRRALLHEAARLFADRGYAAVGLTDVVAAAGVTKGALYHHFGGKADLFRAVLEEVQRDVGRRVADAAGAHEDPWDRLTAGCQEFLTASTAPEVRRIMLVDGPAVLGWNDWRAMDEAASARHLTDVLQELVELGTIPRQPVAPLARLLSGGMNEAALWLASTSSPADLADTRAALDRLLAGLRAR
ncbi:TetR/AcrR family transcriptional regulator [Streptomyces marincola]|uniref:TetR/AcrR family transcriptional regulator n=1 Tax=Streptomyces marincola TaxID=2878388 RepID=UPI001CF391DF|nr:TetR/AcrR family transcriptional regulator [Streptomyces marincola]UCM87903.1 TetR/AcrR family transcriptional regulator [Streptomyces marincola]